MKNFFVATSETQSPLRNQPQVLVIGNFDGVHLGHQQLLAKACSMGARLGKPAIAVTFDPHPMQILRPPHLRLFDQKDQQQQFEKAGLRGVVYLRFSRDFSELSAEQFLDEILGREFAPVGIVVGYNFRFGAGRSGDTEMLKEWGRQNNCEVQVVESVEGADGVISTSAVRKSLQAGDVEKAARLLGRPVYVSGIVVHGESRGHKLGFPTANLHLENLTTPAWGVYATKVKFASSEYLAVSHLGPIPTFSDDLVRLEAHLLDFKGDLYGEMLRVEFIARVRGVLKFPSVDALRAQIQSDIERARVLLGIPK